MTGWSGTRSRNQATPRSMRGIRSPATTRTLKSGRTSPDSRSQPRVRSTCRSDRIQISTSSVIILLALLAGPTLHRLDKGIVVRQLLDADLKLHVDRIADRARVALRVVDEGAFLAARAAAKLGHGVIPLGR